MVEMMSRHVQIFMEKFEYGAADDRRMISLPQSEHVSQYHAAAGAEKAQQQQQQQQQQPAAPPRVSADRGSKNSSRMGDELPGDAQVAAADTGGEKKRRRDSRGPSGETPPRGDQGSPVAVHSDHGSCATCCSTGCVLLHSLGTIPAAQQPPPGGRGKAGAVGSVRRGLATAAITAATAAGIDTVASDGTRAWWLRWLFCLPEDDDYVALPLDAESPAAAVTGEGQAAEPTSHPSDDNPKPREGPLPPYWRSTFPHLYGSTSTSSAKIVEVDRE